MECERPVDLKNPRFGLYREPRIIQVPCGKCCACQANRRKMWFFRLKVESNKCVCSYVVTLTYNDDCLPDYVSNGEFRYHPIQYSDVQAYHKRLRKKVGQFRFFAIGEYGSQRLRPHYHICYFFDRPVDQLDFENAVFSSWFPDCRITIDRTNDKACNYILKYCLSLVDPDFDDTFRPILRCSTKPFIGAGLLDNQEFLDYLHVKRSDISNYVGYKQRLPRIFRDRIFSEEEKSFIKKELGRVMYDRAQKVDEHHIRYREKYGVLSNNFARDQFNSQIIKQAKLKSLR